MATDYPDNIQEVLIPVGSMVPIAVDEKDSGSISTSDSFSALRRKWKLGLKSKTSKSFPEEKKSDESRDDPKKGNHVKRFLEGTNTSPKTNPQSSVFPPNTQKGRNDDTIGFHQSHGNLQVPSRHTGYSSDSGNFMQSKVGAAGHVSRSHRKFHTPRGKQRGYESDVTNNVSHNAGYPRQFQEVIQAPTVRQCSSSSNSYNFAPSGSIDNDQIKANIYFPNGRQQRSYSTDTSNYTPSGSSDADHTRNDRSARTPKLAMNHNSKMKPKFGFMRRKKDQGVKNTLCSGSGAIMGLSPHYGQHSIQSGVIQQPYPYMMQMTPHSSYDQQSIPPPISKVYVKGISPSRQVPVSQRRIVSNAFYMPGNHTVQRSVQDENSQGKSYGFI